MLVAQRVLEIFVKEGQVLEIFQRKGCDTEDFLKRKRRKVQKKCKIVFKTDRILDLVPESTWAFLGSGGVPPREVTEGIRDGFIVPCPPWSIDK